MRHAGYRRALEAAGRPYRPELVVSGRWVRAGGAEAMRRLLDRMSGRHERERRVVRLRSRLVIRDSS